MLPKQRNSKEDNADIKKGAVPLEFGKKDKNGKQSKLCQKDTDARWMTKAGERHFGFKNHINADEETKLITKYSITSAASHDSTEIENIVDKSDNRLHADSAYRIKEIEEYLKANECESFVHEKGYRGNPLTGQQK